MDFKKYHPDWRDIIRPSILKRDNYRCVECGILHKARVYKTTRGQYRQVDEFEEAFLKNQGKRVFTLHLQVAHLNHDKENNEPDNLRTLCPFHHSKYDAAHKSFSRKLYQGKVHEAAPEPKAKAIYFSDEEIMDFQSLVIDNVDIFLTKHKASKLLLLTYKFLNRE
jgi:hypothetical protein